jgi:quercetin dioxygenase-like cupin family protein
MINKKLIGIFEDDRGHLLWASQNLLDFKYKYLTMGTINPGCKRGGHFHKQISEMIMCISGTIILQLDSESIELNPGEIATIPVNVVHTVFNDKENKETATFIEFKSEEFGKEDTYIK